MSDPHQGEGPLLFYDGHCALCHGAVKFVLNRRPRGESIQFAPLQGETFENRVSAEQREALPDSLVVLTRDGRLLTRSAGALFIGRELGGTWKVLAVLGGLVPRPIRDWVYDFIARYRKKWFGTKDDTCPLLPPELRSRFLP